MVVRLVFPIVSCVVDSAIILFVVSIIDSLVVVSFLVVGNPGVDLATIWDTVMMLGNVVVVVVVVVVVLVVVVVVDVVVVVVVVGAAVDGNRMSIGLGKGIQDCDNVQNTDKISSVFRIIFDS